MDLLEFQTVEMARSLRSHQTRIIADRRMRASFKEATFSVDIKVVFYTPGGDPGTPGGDPGHEKSRSSSKSRSSKKYFYLSLKSWV